MSSQPNLVNQSNIPLTPTSLQKLASMMSSISQQTQQIPVQNMADDTITLLGQTIKKTYFYLFMIVIFAVLIYALWKLYKRKNDDDDDDENSEEYPPQPMFVPFSKPEFPPTNNKAQQSKDE